ncbi:TPA: class I SAM-dependent methyltransferase [Candidatus Woesearchaeota archaeon]|nr:hypothetical protein QT06_C0001G0868 [archaeon GW2011_AR15]MBS3103353.1 class I SAM-dependent methyltransferase [Candidatus Woesearchaeota archaeon]HIH41997.1 class I SAM-dependent methyltransferase [Candidatus Woesearchaeota archaeon]
MSKYDVIETFSKIHRKDAHGLPVSGAFDTITHLLDTAAGDIEPSGETVVLDAGSAGGFRTRRYFSGFNLILLDYDHHVLNHSRKRFGGDAEAGSVSADYFSIPVPAESIDLLVANGVNEHYLDPERQTLFEEMYRVVKKGGRMIVMTPNKLNLFHTLWKSISEANGSWEYGPQYDFTQMEMRGRMSQLGFRKIESYGAGTFTSWIRLLPREKQKEYLISPTPFKKLNDLLVRLDSDAGSFFNRYFGREIMVVGYK